MHPAGRSGTYLCPVLHHQRRRQRYRVIYLATDHATVGWQYRVEEQSDYKQNVVYFDVSVRKEVAHEA